jgi:hypothetical protein
VLEVLKPHGILFVQEIYVPKAVLLFGCFEIHLHEHTAVQKCVQLPEQLVTLHGAAEAPAKNPAKVGSNDQ